MAVLMVIIIDEMGIIIEVIVVILEKVVEILVEQGRNSQPFFNLSGANRSES